MIGLTGGIGSGKSTVSAYLVEKGYQVLDADRIAHEITETGSPVLERIAEAFGADMLNGDGSLNRKRLAAAAFSSKENKAVLESLTTKEVIRIIEESVAQLRNEEEYDIIFVDAPLLFEAGVDRITDFVWLVTADEEVRIERVMERDQVSREDVLQRISNQMSDEEKKQRSQELIDNSEGKEVLYRQVEALLRKYA